MYLSEGCNGTLHIGRSADLIHWEFEEQQYLDLEPLKGLLHEVACAAAFDDGRIVLTLLQRGRSRNVRGTGSLPPRQPVHADLAQQGRIAVLGRVVPAPRDMALRPGMGRARRSPQAPLLPLRAGRFHTAREDDTIPPSSPPHARHSLVSGRGSPGSSIQAGSSPSPFRRRSATAPGP